ncbi:MAG: ABC transporter permease [Nitrospiria bacterium]
MTRAADRTMAPSRWRDRSLLDGWSIGVLVLVVLIASLAPVMAPYPFEAQDTASLYAPPSAAHGMGTDRLGRDLLSRIIYGTRTSLLVGLVSALVALVFGTLYGAVSGYVGGRTDRMLMRGLDVLYAVPDLLLIILLGLVMERGVAGMIAAISLVGWMTVARLVRGEILRWRERPFVEAVRASGAGHARILFRHLLPQTFGPLIVTFTFRIPAGILAESTLSFVGLGIAPPQTSWGSLASEGWTALKFYPHLIVFPSLAIFITMLAFNHLGDRLRDRLDPTRARP